MLNREPRPKTLRLIRFDSISRHPFPPNEKAKQQYTLLAPVERAHIYINYFGSLARSQVNDAREQANALCCERRASRRFYYLSLHLTPGANWQLLGNSLALFFSAFPASKCTFTNEISSISLSLWVDKTLSLPACDVQNSWILITCRPAAKRHNVTRASSHLVGVSSRSQPATA